jgi:hypothetical protein
MRVERQLSVILENRPGVLAEVSADLARHSINIEAIHVANLADHCVVRLVVSDPQRALHLLGSAGALVFESDVLAVNLPHRPGALAEVARHLGKARVNIDYLYATTVPRARQSTLYLRVNDVAKAKRALRSYRGGGR